MALQLRRGTEAQRAALTGVDVPALGELLYTTDTKRLYVGDGLTGGGTQAGYFSELAVAGQSNVTAANGTGTLTLVAGSNVTLTTDNNAKTITIGASSSAFDNGDIRIFQNNITSLNSNSNINIDPAGSGKVVITGTVESTDSVTGSLLVGVDYNGGSPAGTSFEIEGGSTSNRLARTTANLSSFLSDAYAFIEIGGYRTSPANGDGGAGLVLRQSTSTTSNYVAVEMFSKMTDITAGSEDSELDIKVRKNNAYITSLIVNGDGIVSPSVVTSSIDTSDSSALTIVPAAVFNSDVTVQNDLTINGKIKGDIKGEALTISQNNIRSTISNADIVIDPNGTGVVTVNGTLRTSRLEMFIDILNSGITMANGTPTNASFVLSTAHNTASTSPSFVNTLGDFTGPVGGATLTFLRSRGNLAAPTVVSVNDELGTFDFNALSGVSGYSSAVKIRAAIDDTVSDTIAPGRFEVATTNGSGVSATRFSVSAKSVTSTVPFKLPVYADDTARSAGVPSPVQGMVIFMQSGTTPAATNVAQVYDGTNWVNL